MINFEEEIKRFKPCLEIEQAEESIYAYESKDVSDILQEMLREIKNDDK